MEVYKTITRDTLRRKLAEHDESLALIELLPRSDYQKACLPQALNIPLDDIQVMVPRLFPNRYETIVLYGSGSDELPKKAAELLFRLGYKNARIYAEGKSGWIAAGLPVEASDLSSAAA